MAVQYSIQHFLSCLILTLYKVNFKQFFCLNCGLCDLYDFFDFKVLLKFPFGTKGWQAKPDGIVIKK